MRSLALRIEHLAMGRKACNDAMRDWCAAGDVATNREADRQGRTASRLDAAADERLA